MRTRSKTVDREALFVVVWNERVILYNQALIDFHDVPEWFSVLMVF